MVDELRILTPVSAPAEAELPPTRHWVAGKICKLAEVKAGHLVKIMAVQLSDPARGKLYAQGLTENQKAMVIHNDYRGRVMLNRQGEIYLLGRRETSQIQVRPFTKES
ncbi:ferrous iron transport protein A [Kiritimatiellota bacterium B12222]|nr:ferrous iron transport protein A [Kiritimatiellota bacterium B12222]